VSITTRATRAVALAVTCAAVAAAPASAHVGVKSYSPKRGSTVSRGLERVTVTFKGRITDGKLTVRNAAGVKVSRGDGSVVNGDRVLRVRLKDGLKRGRYAVSMNVLHTDGHVRNTSWSFNLN
jgi:prepilin-type processing-associated H-X9-DG protein